MTYPIADGWHFIARHRLYVEDGRVMRAMKLDSSGSWVPAGIYKRHPSGGWANVNGEYTVETVRHGIKSGRYKVA